MGMKDQDFQLGPWIVRPSLLELHREGEVRALGPMVMDLLLCLAEKPGEAISKDALIESVWQGAFTSDEALTTAVYELRKALDDDARRPAFVGTIRGRGYRLLVTPEPVTEPPSEDSPEGAAEPGPIVTDPGPESPAPADGDSAASVPEIAVAPASSTPTSSTPARDSSGSAIPKQASKLGIGIGIVLLVIASFVLGPGGDESEERSVAPNDAASAPTSPRPASPVSTSPGHSDGDSSAGSIKPTGSMESTGSIESTPPNGSTPSTPIPTADDTRQPPGLPGATEPAVPRVSLPAGSGLAESGPSVAILPLETVAAEASADALAERLAVDLSRLGGLEIVPGFSSVVETGSGDLGTDAVVEGSVRRLGGMLAVSIRLVDRSSRRLLWGGNYEYEAGDELRMQRQLSLEIARQVRDHLAPPARTPDPRAAEAFRLGDYFLGLDTPSGRAKAVDYFSLAIDHDPGWASAHAGLAEAWIESAAELPAESRAPAYDKAREAAEAALVLDSDLPEAHASLGSFYFQHLWDWPRAEAHFRLGCPPDTCSTEDAPRYAAFLSAMGRHEEALAVLEGSLVHDPASKRASLGLARALYLARDFERAARALERSRELDPDYPPLLRLEVDILLAMGRDPEAVKVLSRLVPMPEAPATSVDIEAQDPEAIYRQSGMAGVLRWAIAHSGAETEVADPIWMASLEARAGGTEAAMGWLQRAFEERHEALVWIGVDPAFDGLRRHPGLAELIERLELSPWAVSGPF